MGIAQTHCCVCVALFATCIHILRLGAGARDVELTNDGGMVLRTTDAPRVTIIFGDFVPGQGSSRPTRRLYLIQQGTQLRCLGMRLGVLAFFCAGTMAIAETVVVIDPGHGGQPSPGKADSSQEGDGASWNNAKSASGRFLEKDLTLHFAQAVERAFRNHPKAKALAVKPVLTRTADVHLSALERAAVAVRESADVFVSIHFNAAGGKAEGTRVFYGASDHPDWEFMHFRNAYEGRDRRFSELLGAKVAAAFQPFGGKPEKMRVQPDSADRKDGFRVLGYVRQDTHLRNTAACLLEVEFIDNPAVEQWLLPDDNRENVVAAFANAVVEGTCEWVALPPAQRDYVEKARKVRTIGTSPARGPSAAE